MLRLQKTPEAKDRRKLGSSGLTSLLQMLPAGRPHLSFQSFHFQSTHCARCSPGLRKDAGIQGTKRLVLGVQVPWNLDVNVSIAGVLMLRGPGRPQEAAGPFPASAARDPGAPCWQRLEGSSSPDKRGAGVPQLTWSPLPRPSLQAASGQWLGVVGGTRKARGLETGPSASVATGGREQDRSAQWTSALGKR